MVLKINPSTGELDLVGSGGGAGADATDLTGDVGAKVTGGAGDNIDLIGDATQAFIETTGTPASNKMEIKLVKPAIDGQLLIGHTANAEPSAATLTGGSGITITNGAGSIKIDADTSDDLSVPTDGTTANSSNSVLSIVGGTGVDTDGSGNTVTINASAAVPTTFTMDSGNASPVGNSIALSGGTGINTSGAGAVQTINLDVPVKVIHGGTEATSLTDGGIMLGSGVGAVTVTAQPTNGQLLIGSTGVDPVLGTLTAPAAGFTITGGAGTVTFALGDDLAAVEGLATAGMVARTAANTWTTRTIAGGTGITVTNGNGVAEAPSIALTIPVPESSGGTNQTTYNKGDVIYSDASNSLDKLAIGTQSQVMTVSATGIPEWNSPVVETVGGTNQTTYTKGDVLYSDAANSLEKLPIGSENEVLTVSATGIPEWASSSGGGGVWTVINTLTFATDAEVSQTSGMGTAYDEYMVIFTGFQRSSGAVPTVEVYWSDDGGSTYVIPFAGVQMVHEFATDSFNNINSQTGLELAQPTVGSTERQLGWINWTANKISQQKPVRISTKSRNTYYATYDGLLETTNDIDAIKILADGNTLDAGTVVIMGK